MQTEPQSRDKSPHSGGFAPHPSSIDLLTAVLHEIGHVLGQDHEVDGLMADILQAGERKSPTLVDIDEVLASGNW